MCSCYDWFEVVLEGVGCGSVVFGRICLIVVFVDGYYNWCVWYFVIFVVELIGVVIS